MAGINMACEICAMAGLAGTATGRHGRGLAIGGLQGATCTVTGIASIMNFWVSRIDWNTGRGADNAGRQMAILTVD